MKSGWLMAIMAVAALAAGAVGWQVRQALAADQGRAALAGAGQGDSSGKKSEAKTGDAEADAEITELVAPGLVEGSGEVLDLAFDRAGRITAVLVDEGAHVEKGQVLARLDDRVARAHVAQAEAVLAAARARRDAAFRGSRVAEIREAEAEVDGARAQARNQESERLRADRLISAAAITTVEAERTRSGADAATARLASAEARLAIIREGTRGELKRAAGAEVAAAEANLEETRILLYQTILVAPEPGVVLRRRAEPGEQVVLIPPTVVVRMANLDELRLRAEVDEEDVERIAVGQVGFADARAFGAHRFPGRLLRILGELGRKSVRDDDPRSRVDTRVLEVVFRFDARPTLPIGLRMDLHLPARR
jgi:multidrug resistance efflux pump